MRSRHGQWTVNDSDPERLLQLSSDTLRIPYVANWDNLVLIV